MTEQDLEARVATAEKRALDLIHDMIVNRRPRDGHARGLRRSANGVLRPARMAVLRGDTPAARPVPRRTRGRVAVRAERRGA